MDLVRTIAEAIDEGDGDVERLTAEMRLRAFPGMPVLELFDALIRDVDQIIPSPMFRRAALRRIWANRLLLALNPDTLL
jgi:hypothetical protein